MKKKVSSTVKDEYLIKERRGQMIHGAVQLFIKKGFHKTTTREIAQAAGFSNGTLYEYIRNKEDILYLVCDHIYDVFSEKLFYELNQSDGTLITLKRGIANYFQLVDEMQDEILVMYQEVKSLPKDALKYVIQKELLMVEKFESVIEKCVEKGELHWEKEKINIHAHNIFIFGQMWAFRRWEIQKHYTIETYIDIQLNILFNNQ